MGAMDQTTLVDDLKKMLNDSANKFEADDTDFVRQLDFALGDVSRVRPYRQMGSITLTADVGEYSAPANFFKMDFPLWGNAERRTRQPWNSNYPGPAPSVTVFGSGTGKTISLEPAPSAAQIFNLGDQYRFYYRALHVISVIEADTTVDVADRDLLLIRAAAQAMQELAARGVTKPIKLGGSGVGAMPKNGTPAALAEGLMKLFESMTA